MGRERRRHTRIYIEFPIKFVNKAGLVLEGNCVNLSFGGCLVVFKELPESPINWEQDKWVIRLYADGAENSPIRFNAKMAGELPSGAIGIQYTGASFRDFTRYREYLLKIAPEQRSEILAELSKYEGIGEEFMSNFASQPLGEVIQVLYKVDKEQVDQALKEQKRTQRKIGDILVSRDIITQPQLDACLSLFVNAENTLFSHGMLPALPKGAWARRFQLSIEAFLVVLATILIMHGLAGINESGLISLFLVSTALTSRLNEILQDKNLAHEASDLLSVFAGMFVGYIAVAINISPHTFNDMFGFVLEITKVEAETTIWNRTFHNTIGLLINNCFVLLSLAFLSFMYRGFAVLLTLSWNACTWGLVITIMVRQGIQSSPEHLSSATTVIISIVALTPHLALEALAYIIGALGAIGASKSSLWHQFMSNRFRHDMVRHGKALIISVGVLAVAALCEGYWVKFILKWFSEAPT